MSAVTKGYRLSDPTAVAVTCVGGIGGRTWTDESDADFHSRMHRTWKLRKVTQQREAARRQRRAVMQAARDAETQRRASLSADVDSDYNRLTPLDWLRADEARGMLPTDGAMVTERRTIIGETGHIGVVCETRGAMVKLERLYLDYRSERDDIGRAMREGNVKPLADVRASEPWKRSDLRKVKGWNGACYSVAADGTRERFVSERDALEAAQRDALRDATPSESRQAASERDAETRDAAARLRAIVATVDHGAREAAAAGS